MIKRVKIERVSPLNLGYWIPQKDVRRLIWWKYLNHVDRMLVWAAHIKKIAKELQNSSVFRRDCAQKGYLNVLKWLNKNVRNEDHEMAIIAQIASTYGHLDILIWVDKKERLTDYDGSLVCKAAIGGHLHILEWFKMERINININAICAISAEKGHWNILKWIKRDDYSKCDWRVCSNAAHRGDLPMLKWLRQNGCPWNIYAPIGAVSGGHLETLEWTIRNGCPYIKNSLFVHSPNQNVTDWLLKNLK